MAPAWRITLIDFWRTLLMQRVHWPQRLLVCGTSLILKYLLFILTCSLLCGRKVFLVSFIDRFIVRYWIRMSYFCVLFFWSSLRWVAFCFDINYFYLLEITCFVKNRAPCSLFYGGFTVKYQIEITAKVWPSLIHPKIVSVYVKFLYL